MPSLRARWTMTCLGKVCAAFAISVFLPTLLSAQGASGRIVGRVADPTGAVLAAVNRSLASLGEHVTELHRPVFASS